MNKTKYYFHLILIFLKMFSILFNFKYIYKLNEFFLKKKKRHSGIILFNPVNNNLKKRATYPRPKNQTQHNPKSKTHNIRPQAQLIACANIKEISKRSFILGSFYQLKFHMGSSSQSEPPNLPM